MIKHKFEGLWLWCYGTCMVMVVCDMVHLGDVMVH
jgi:hypothetical protein